MDHQANAIRPALIIDAVLADYASSTSETALRHRDLPAS
jgi:hypothetical protein